MIFTTRSRRSDVQRATSRAALGRKSWRGAVKASPARHHPTRFEGLFVLSWLPCSRSIRLQRAIPSPVGGQWPVLLGGSTPCRPGYARPDAEATALAHQFQVPEFVQLPRCLVGFLKRLAVVGGSHLRELTERDIGKSKCLAQSFILGHHCVTCCARACKTVEPTCAVPARMYRREQWAALGRRALARPLPPYVAMVNCGGADENLSRLNGDGVVDKDTDDEQRCPTCGGSGFVPDKRRRRRIKHIALIGRVCRCACAQRVVGGFILRLRRPLVRYSGLAARVIPANPQNASASSVSHCGPVRRIDSVPTR